MKWVSEKASLRLQLFDLSKSLLSSRNGPQKLLRTQILCLCGVFCTVGSYPSRFLQTLACVSVISQNISDMERELSIQYKNFYIKKKGPESWPPRLCTCHYPRLWHVLPPQLSLFLTKIVLFILVFYCFY